MMGDHYSPNDRRGRGRDDRKPRYGEPYEPRDRFDRDNRDRFEQDSRDRFDRDNRVRFERDSRDRHRSRSPPRNPRAGGRYNDGRFKLPRPEDFKSRKQPPPPPPARLLPPEPPKRPREDAHRVEDNRGQRGRRREGGRQAGRPRGGANTRDILHGRGGSTPEQLSGMSAQGQNRFIAIASSDEEESGGKNIFDITRKSDDDDSGQGPHKRVRIESPAPPKWSNPDPYTAIPPPDTLGGPKKDIVRSIRKAKVETGPNTGLGKAVQNNEDYISFNDDISEEGELSDSDSTGTSNAPFYSGKTISPIGRYYARYLGTGKKESNSTTSRNARTLNLDDEVGSPPLPPKDLEMPTNEELLNEYGKKPRRNKRKRGELEISQADILPEWQARDSDSTPWCKVDHSPRADPALKLHVEVCDFWDFVRPRAYEADIRLDLVDRVQDAVRRYGPFYPEVRPFGSFAAGLYLPTADMDLVAVSPQFLRDGTPKVFQRPNLMHRLGDYLENSGIAAVNSVQVVAHAKVPIVKFIEKKTGIKVDVSFENSTGLKANETFEEWKEKYPAMPQIVVLIKQLLAMRGLNEVFHGGLGGFSIICLVVSMMEMMPELQTYSMDPEQHYGDLLLHFLDLYGNKFDVTSTGIKMNPIGYFDKIKNPAKNQNPRHLTIIDPNNPNNDISGGSRKIEQIFKCFRNAHAALQSRLSKISSGDEVEGSILGVILGGNYSSFVRQRNKLSAISEGRAVSPPSVPSPKQSERVKLPARGKKKRRGAGW